MYFKSEYWPMKCTLVALKHSTLDLNIQYQVLQERKEDVLRKEM